MKFFLLIFTLFSINVFAMPKKLEVWFLSPKKNAFIDRLDFKIKTLKIIAQNNLQCQQMGDFCFDPQVGLYKPSDNGEVSEIENDYNEADQQETYKSVEYAKSVDRNLIECDDTNLFDFFCGKAKNKKNKVKLEVWIDVSSTMKQIDPDLSDDICRRQAFVSAIENKCPLEEKLKVQVFTESIKKVDTLSRVCGHYGLNNINRLQKQIKASNVDSLIIITDIFEASQAFISFIENSTIGTYKGVDKPFYISDLKEHQSELIKMCK